jgi:hypothetical protein
MIKPEDLEGAPRDNVGTFLHLERRARDRHKEVLDDLDERYGNDADHSECNFAYTRAVLAAANACGIEELSEWTLPRYGEEDWRQDCLNFKAAAEFVAAKLLIQRHRQRDTYSVAIDTPTKLKLEHYVREGRDLIHKLSMPLPKREVLLGCLNAFVAELDRERTDLQVYGALAAEAANTTDEVASAFAPVIRRIGKMLGLSREAEDARERAKLLTAAETKRIAGPPKRPVFDKKIDDEIPF